MTTELQSSAATQHAGRLSSCGLCDHMWCQAQRLSLGAHNFAGAEMADRRNALRFAFESQTNTVFRPASVGIEGEAVKLLSGNGGSNRRASIFAEGRGLSQLRARTAGKTGPNRITQALISTFSGYTFAGRVNAGTAEGQPHYVIPSGSHTHVFPWLAGGRTRRGECWRLRLNQSSGDPRQLFRDRERSNAILAWEITKMGLKRTDLGYEKAARIDPYYAVIPFSKFRRSQLNDETLAEFFELGSRHAERVLGYIRSHFQADFQPRRILDYGCGTGRVLIPLARGADKAIGLDVSVTMLEETRANCRRMGAENIDLAVADDELTALAGKFDLIHSSIVFQHIPGHRVEKIVKGLLRHLEPSGFGSLGFAFWSPPKLRMARWLKRTLPFGNTLSNVLKRRDWNYGYIDLYTLSMDRIVGLLCDAGVRELVANFDDGKAFGGDRSVHLTFRAAG